MEIKKRNEKRVRKNLLVYTDDGRFDLLGVSSNISKSGLFIESPYSISSNSEVLLAVVIDDELFRLKGEVRWVKRAEDKYPAHTPAGMGIHITEAPVEYLNYVDYARYETNSGSNVSNG
jgi:Tfp pilus assembly protein PilZ